MEPAEEYSDAISVFFYDGVAILVNISIAYKSSQH